MRGHGIHHSTRPVGVNCGELPPEHRGPGNLPQLGVRAGAPRLKEWSVLSPSFPYTPAIAAVLLGALLVWLMVRAVRKDRREYSRFKRYRTTAKRQSLYRKWVLESFLVFGGSALVVTVLVWQHIPLFFDQFYQLPGIVEFGHLVSDTGALIPGIAIVGTAIVIVGS